MSWLTTPPTARQFSRVAVVGLLAVGLAAAGCTKKTDSPGAGGKLAAGPGVTDTTIKLGVLTDLSGPYAPLEKAVAQGRALYWEKQNNTVCNRTVEFVTKDHGYKVPDATAAYAAVKSDVLALAELLGSPEIAALKSDINSDQMLTGALSWSSANIDNPYIVIPGTTYDADMINGVQWLMDKKGIVKGDKIGHIYVEGEFGENGRAGSKVAAAAAGLELKEYKIGATATDLTAQITTAKADGVKALLITTTPAQAGSAVGVAVAQGLEVPIVASGPSFSGTLLTGAAKAAVEKNMYITTSIAAFSSPGAGTAAVKAALTAKFGADLAKSQYGLLGYAQAQIMHTILDTACKNKDLTRAGLLKAFQSLTEVKTDGVLPTLDYSKIGGIPARSSYILKPNSATEGGLDQIADLFTSPTAITYTPKK